MSDSPDSTRPPSDYLEIAGSIAVSSRSQDPGSHGLDMCCIKFCSGMHTLRSADVNLIDLGVLVSQFLHVRSKHSKKWTGGHSSLSCQPDLKGADLHLQAISCQMTVKHRSSNVEVE